MYTIYVFFSNKADGRFPSGKAETSYHDFWDGYLRCMCHGMALEMTDLLPIQILTSGFFPTSHNEVRTLVSLSGYKYRMHMHT